MLASLSRPSVSLHWSNHNKSKDQLGELEQEYQNFQRDVQDTKRALKRGYRSLIGERTNNKNNDNSNEVGVPPSPPRRRIKADFGLKPELFKLDWKEFIDSTKQWNKKNPDNVINKENLNPADDDLEVDGSFKDIRRQLENFEKTLSDPSFVDDLNTIIKSKLSSPTELIAYYAQRPKLKTLTLMADLPRMDYTVITHTGERLTSPEDIVEYNRLNPNPDFDILWRAANQSIFGDIIVCLTSSTALIRPQFCSATSVNDVNIVLDLGCKNPHVTAECFVNVTIFGPGQKDGRHSLAGVLLRVHFCPVLKVMEARVLHIFPSPKMSPIQLTGAAEALAIR